MTALIALVDARLVGGGVQQVEQGLDVVVAADGQVEPLVQTKLVT
ncbi:hypothetical protein [Streptomyces coeruleorubidus]